MSSVRAERAQSRRRCARSSDCSKSSFSKVRIALIAAVDRKCDSFVHVLVRVCRLHQSLAHDEVAAVHESKVKLCETIGSLQRAKDERDDEVKQLKIELKASRDSQAALMKKLHRLEAEKQDMKRGYIKCAHSRGASAIPVACLVDQRTGLLCGCARSLACRMKSAAQLLSQLQSANVYPHIQGKVHSRDGSASWRSADERSLARSIDLSISTEVASKCEEWIGGEPNKRKRALTGAAATKEDEERTPETEVQAASLLMKCMRSTR